MVYHYSGRGLEGRAEKLLREWSPSVLEQVVSVDIEAFAEQYVGADVNWFRLSEDGSILGLTCFDNRPFPVFSEDGLSQEVVCGHAGMIVICPHAWEIGGDRRGRFTIAHECAHVLLHSADDLADSETLAAHAVGGDVINDLADGSRCVDNWMEWQANRLGACLLMPKTLMKQAVAQVAEKNTDGSYLVDSEGVQALAEVFDVSKEAMRIRIEQLARLNLLRVTLGSDVTGGETMT